MDEQNVSLQGEAPAQPQVPQEPVVAEQTQEASPPPDTEAPAEKPKGDLPPIQKRIDQLTWKAHEAERRYNAELIRRQEAEEFARKLYEQQQELMRKATMPRMEDVGHDPEAYAKTVQEHYEKWLQQQRQDAEQRDQTRRQMEARLQFEQTMQARIAEAKQKFADYEDVVNNPALPPLPSVNPAVMAAILDHEQMPDITYYLGKNPAEAHRIAALPPAKAILEVGKIAARIGSSPQPSKAPPPPAQVTGHSATAQKDPSQMSYDEFVAWRRKQIAARR